MTPTTPAPDASPARGRRLSWAALAAAAALVFGVALGVTVLVGAALRPDPSPAPPIAAPTVTALPSAGLPVVAPDPTASASPAPSTTASATRSRSTPSPRTTEAPPRDRTDRSEDTSDSGGRSRASQFGEELRDRILGRLGRDD